MINRSKGIKFFVTAAILAAVSAIYIFGGLRLVYSDQWKTDWSKYSIDRNEFMRGGPPKDGIPSIDRPQFIKPDEAGSWLADREPVISLTINGDARAYPLQILIWHELVNDEVGGSPVLVSF